MVELDAALAAIGTVTPQLKEDATASDTLAVCKTTISLLSLVYLLFGSPFLTPINAWNMITARAASMGLERRMLPLLQWLRAQI